MKSLQAPDDGGIVASPACIPDVVVGTSTGFGVGAGDRLNNSSTSIVLKVEVGIVEATVGAVPVGRSEVVMLPDEDVVNEGLMVGAEEPFGELGFGVACCDDCDDGPGETDGSNVGASVDTK